MARLGTVILVVPFVKVIGPVFEKSAFCAPSCQRTAMAACPPGRERVPVQLPGNPPPLVVVALGPVGEFPPPEPPFAQPATQKIAVRIIPNALDGRMGRSIAL